MNLISTILETFPRNLPTLLLGTTVGYYSPLLTGVFMYTGQAGVDYYAEAHMTRWNSFIHTLGMPFTIYGFVLSIPALFRLDPEKATRVALFLYTAYGGHYLTINAKITLLYYILFGYSTIRAVRDYRLTFKVDENKNDSLDSSWSLRGLIVKSKNVFSPHVRLLVGGLSISVSALLFQEVVGHYLGGDIPSRGEAVPNAILYAKYFAVSHIFN